MQRFETESNLMLTDLKSAFNDIPTGYTPTSPLDTSFQDHLRLENINTPQPLELCDGDAYFVYPPKSTTIDNQTYSTTTTTNSLFYCQPDSCYQTTDGPNFMTASYPSSSSTGSARSLTCLEVNTRHSFHGFPDDRLFGTETTGSVPSTDSSLSPPQSFSSSSENTMIELTGPVSQSVPSYEYGVAAGSCVPPLKVEDNHTVYNTQTGSFLPELSTVRACVRPQTLNCVYKPEPAEYVYDQTDPMMTLKSNEPTLKAQDKVLCTLYQRKSLPSSASSCSASSCSASTESAQTTRPAAPTAPTGTGKPNRTLEKAFACQMFDCTKRFARIDELKRHQRTHSDVKQFICDICTKGFTRSDHLMTHRRTHTGERPYQCAYCERRFARSDERNRHSKVHFREKSKCGRKPKTVPATTDRTDRTQSSSSSSSQGPSALPWTAAFEELSLRR